MLRENKRSKQVIRTRESNPIVYMDIFCSGGIKLPSGEVTVSKPIGRLYFELRSDLVPVTCANFLSLISGSRGVGFDGIKYSYKGTKIHRICRDVLFEGGDLLGENGECSRSIYNNGGLFSDENYILRHCGPGVLSMCNQGPDTNGSLFQVIMTESPDMDGRYVVFGCTVGTESFDTLRAINTYGSYWGEPTDNIIIKDCGVTY